MTKLLLFAALFLFIFGWRVGSVDLTVAVATLLATYVFGVQRQVVERRTMGLLLLCLLVVVDAATISALAGGVDAFAAARSMRAVVIVFGGAALAMLYWRSFGPYLLEAATRHVFAAVVLHGVIMLGMYASPTLRSFVLAMCGTLQYLNNPESVVLGLRIPGLTYGLGTTSVLQMFALLLVPAVWESTVNPLHRLALLLGSVIVLASAALAGRTGIVLGLFLFPVVAAFSMRGATPRTVASGVAAFFAATFTVALAFFAFMGSDLQQTQQLKFTASHLNEIWSLLNAGESGTASALGRMVFFPDDPFVLLFGASNSGRGTGMYIPSDIGFVLGIFSVGLLGTILSVLPYLYGCLVAGRAIPALGTIGAAVAAILIMGILAHFKQVALYTRQLWSVEVFLLCTLLLKLAISERRAAAPLLPRHREAVT